MLISRMFSPFQAFARVVPSISPPFAMPGVYFRSFFRPHLRCDSHLEALPTSHYIQAGSGLPSLGLPYL